MKDHRPQRKKEKKPKPELPIRKVDPYEFTQCSKCPAKTKDAYTLAVLENNRISARAASVLYMHACDKG